MLINEMLKDIKEGLKRNSLEDRISVDMEKAMLTNGRGLRVMVSAIHTELILSIMDTEFRANLDWDPNSKTFKSTWSGWCTLDIKDIKTLDICSFMSENEMRFFGFNKFRIALI